ncbi:MAG TPA: hypothetical protein VLM05_11110, partial [Mycobacteriales bacterium]|nr:hypothetical protein [Mycobacteriales bacterium]
MVGPGALAPVTVTVPAGLRQAPFDVPRRLSVPAGWSAAVYARIPGARFLAYAGGGSEDLLVSQPSTGSVQLVRRQADGSARVTPWLTGLNGPHDIVPAGSWVYVAERTRVVRYPWTRGAPTPGPGRVVVAGLPTGGHEL